MCAFGYQILKPIQHMLRGLEMADGNDWYQGDISLCGELEKTVTFWFTWKVNTRGREHGR